MRELIAPRYTLHLTVLGGPARLTLTRGERIGEAPFALVPRADRRRFRRVAQANAQAAPSSDPTPTHDGDS